MRVVIFGAAGRTGRELVKQALARGYEVTGFAHHPEKIGQLHAHLRTLTGDVFDLRRVREALAGHDAVISVLANPSLQSVEKRSAEGTRVILAAMEAEGVRRLIAVSASGAGETRGFLPMRDRLMLRHVLADKDLLEQYVKASGVDWVLVRPAVLVDAEPVGAVEVAMHHPTEQHQLARADLAMFLLDQLESDRFLHQAPTVAAPSTEWDRWREGQRRGAHASESASS